MSVQILDETKKIKNIIHLSDIHIRKTRVEEYNQVFSETYNKINNIIKEKSDNGLIVVCGDITDNKLMLTPVIVDQIKNFFIGLTNITDTMIILGNHDVAISNKNALDALTPLIKNFNTKHKLYLLKENKVYLYGNLLVGVTDIYSKKVTPITEDINKKYPNKKKIALYHGTINNCFSESGFKFTNSGYFKIKDFEQYYDYGMFGDIHSFQYLDKNNKFAYSSSLVEQRISEANQSHGFLHWDIKNGTSKYINVENNYKYIILKVNNNKISQLISKPNCKDNINLIDYNKNNIKIKYPKIRLYYKNTKLSQINKIEEILQKNHNKMTELIKMNDSDDQLDFNYGLDDSDSEENNEENKIIEIKDYKTIKKLIKGFLKKYNIEWTTEKKKIVFNLLKGIMKDIDIKSNDKKIINLKSLEFENLFSYGKSNEVNFTKFGKNKVIGILGNNSNGKSALIDAILFSIYDKFSRGVNNDALNINEKKCNSRVKLEVNNNEFIIEREIKKSGNRSLPSLQLYKNGKLITNDRKSTTTQNIYDNICEYEDIVNNNIILQFSQNFLDINDSKKRDYLYQILNLDLFNEIVKLANSRKGVIKAQEYTYKKNLAKYDEKEIQLNINNTLDKINKIKNNINLLEDKKINYEKQLLQLKILVGDNYNNLSKINLDDLRKNIDNKKLIISANNKNIVNYDKIINNINKNINKCNKKISKYTNAKKDHDTFEINKNILIGELKKIRDNFMKTIIPISESYNNMETIIQKYKNDLLVLDNKLLDIINEKTSINNKIIKFKKLIKKIDNFEVLEKNYKNNCIIEKDKNKLEDQINDYNDKIIIYKNKLKKLENHKYDKNCKFCMLSQTTKEKLYFIENIDELNDKINSNIDKIKILDKKINKIHEKLYNKALDDIETNKKYEQKIINNNHKNNIMIKDIEIVKNKKTIILNNIKTGKEKLDQITKNNYCKNQIKTIDLMIKYAENKVDNKYNIYLQIINKHDELNKNIEINKNNLNILKKQNELDKKELIILEKDYTKYNKLLEKFDNNIIENINIIENNIKLTKNEINQLNENIVILNKNLTENEYNIKKIYELKENINDCSDKYENYTEINNIIETKNGLVNHIMNNIILIQIESKVNVILSLLTDFLIELKYNNKKIVVYKKEGSNRLKAVNLCGFERFVCNMAFRLVFNQINTKISCNFLIIDEGFSCCDSENLIKVKQLFDFIKQKYSWCLAITHLDTIKDYFDETIKIEKNNGKSHIVY